MNKKVSVLFLFLSLLFCVCLITSNLLGTKQIQVGPIALTGGVLVFPVSYIINDCVSEVWGFRMTRLLIWMGFLMNFFVVAVCALCDWIPGASYWQFDEQFHYVFGLAPRIAAASFLAFLCGSFVNAYVMSRMKVRDQGRRFTLRAVLSSVFGEVIDSLIFFPLALGGVIPWEAMPAMMFWQVVLKTAYEVVALPLTVRVVRFVKRYEQTDVYDENISYNVLKVFSI
ncbi:MAG: queuosine precursor transporter [Prevotella sp.]|nr:queuosine precursor transporter [Prevotella sp.]